MRVACAEPSVGRCLDLIVGEVDFEFLAHWPTGPNESSLFGEAYSVTRRMLYGCVWDLMLRIVEGRKVTILIMEYCKDYILT